MFNTPTLAHHFKVSLIHNDWSDNMTYFFVNSILEVDINYVAKELYVKISNTVNTIIQHSILDMIDTGLRELTIEIYDTNNKDIQQVMKFNGLEAIHHSLKFSYSEAEAGISYHYIVLKYINNRVINGSGR